MTIEDEAMWSEVFEKDPVVTETFLLLGRGARGDILLELEQHIKRRADFIHESHRALERLRGIK